MTAKGGLGGEVVAVVTALGRFEAWSKPPPFAEAAKSGAPGGSVVLGLDEGSREKAARKEGDERRFFLARLKPCPDERRLLVGIFFANVRAC
jgi:hypothetical protein